MAAIERKPYMDRIDRLKQRVSCIRQIIKHRYKMKMRRISYLLIALFPFFCLTTYGQNEALTKDIRTAINKVFEHTDLSKVPTGIWWITE